MKNLEGKTIAIEDDYKDGVLKSYDEYDRKANDPIVARNIMGADENWYTADYAIHETFTREEIEHMSNTEVNHLVALAENLSEAFY